ncbi:hypothetical protein C7330_0241 [Pectobacterium versatile]|nr:hypothetical protein C7330_0241 [Pectobacterium versatile]
MYECKRELFAFGNLAKNSTYVQFLLWRYAGERKNEQQQVGNSFPTRKSYYLAEGVIQGRNRLMNQFAWQRAFMFFQQCTDEKAVQ